MTVTPRDAATVVLLRPRAATGSETGADAAGYEVFLLRRRKNASFMSGAFVFPGGAAEPGEDDPRITAARELFEEAGVLLAHGAPVDKLAALRDRCLADEPAAEVLAEHGLAFDCEAMQYFAHWITPSAEAKRFSARFYVAVLPPGQDPSYCKRETVDQIWVTPPEALARIGELALPPPQVRTFLDLLEARTIDDVFALARHRAEAPAPVMPRMASIALPTGQGFALLLPWDPEYLSAGTGDAAPLPADHPLAVGPSRFVMEDRAWKHVFAPPSMPAGS